MSANASTAPALTSQQRTLLEHLKSGRSLTNQIALITFGVGSLTSRIAELRKKGYDIKSTRHRDPNGALYVKYRLTEQDARPQPIPE